jgi:hypothetical protein
VRIFFSWISRFFNAGDRPPNNSFVPSTTIELANFIAILPKLDALLILPLGTGNDLDSVFLSINDLFWNPYGFSGFT